MEGRAPRLLGIGEIVDRSITLYLRGLPSFLLIAAAFAIPMGVVIYLLDQLAFAAPEAGISDREVILVGHFEQEVDFSTFALVSGLEIAVAFIAFLLVIGASFHAASELHAGRDATAGRSLREALAHIGPLIWMSVLFALGVGLATLALIIPGIWLLVAWSVAVPALMSERVGGAASLGRSFGLVRDNWWRTFGALLLGFLFVALLEFLFGRVASGLTTFTEDSLQGSLLITDAAQALALAITGPLQAALVAVIYYDLRARKEGFHFGSDEEPAAETRAGPTPKPPPPPPSTPSGW